MAQEEIDYTLPYDTVNGVAGSQVHLILTYDENAPGAGSTYNSYLVTAISGTYSTLDATGAIIHTDTVTGLSPSDNLLGGDNVIYLDQGAGVQIVDGQGLTFTISNAADSNDGAHDVNFFYGGDVNNGEGYQELGNNYNDATNVTYNAVCFVSGTLIRCVRGDVPVESLAVGDVVVTASGQERPIRWLGQRTVTCSETPDPREVWPIRIRAGAFADNMPARDLMVSPGHALCVTCVDEVLIPAHLLANGATISQIPVETVTYWHVELDSHDILIANGMPAESYQDVGNREFFATGQGAIDPDRSTASVADYCRLFVTDPLLVRAIRSQLRRRAMALGWQLDTAPSVDLQVVADGQVVRPDADGLTARFLLAAQASDVWLVSRTAVPMHTQDSTDNRALGVAVRCLSVDDGLACRRTVAADDPSLAEGFYGEEGDGDMRWTNGRARLPASLWQGARGYVFLKVELASETPPRWIAPAVGPMLMLERGDRLRLVRVSA